MFKLEPETKSGSNLQITEVTSLPLISPRGPTYNYMLPVTGRRGDTSGYRQLSNMHAVKRKKNLTAAERSSGRQHVCQLSDCLVQSAGRLLHQRRRALLGEARHVAPELKNRWSNDELLRANAHNTETCSTYRCVTILPTWYFRQSASVIL